MTLVSGNIRFMRIFAGVPWRGGVKQQWGNRKHGFYGLVPQRGPGASHGGGLGASPPGSQIFTNNLQLSYAFLRRFVAESVLHLSPAPPLKNSSVLRESHDPTQSGQGGHKRPLHFASRLFPNTLCHLFADFLKTSPHDVGSSAIEKVHFAFT